MYCPECGEEIPDESAFCRQCGHQIDEDDSDEGEEAPTETTTEAPAASESTTSQGDGGTGLEPNVAGALSYLFGFVTGLIFFLIEEEDDFVRFHAAQSMVVFGGLFVIYIIFTFVNSFIFGALFTVETFFLWGLISLVMTLFWFILALGSLVLWVYLMVRAYQGDTPRIPIAAGIADDLV